MAAKTGEGIAGTINMPANNAPCPTCGTCPTCGNRRYYTGYGYYQPFYGGNYI